MAKTSGRWVSLSPTRLFITDLLHVARQTPTVIAERTFDLHEVVAARASCTPKPSWVAIFLKAFGLVAARRAPLRRVFLSRPFERLYEHSCSIASFSVERE